MNRLFSALKSRLSSREGEQKWHKCLAFLCFVPSDCCSGRWLGNIFFSFPYALAVPWYMATVQEPKFCNPKECWLFTGLQKAEHSACNSLATPFSPKNPEDSFVLTVRSRIWEWPGQTKPSVLFSTVGKQKLPTRCESVKHPLQFVPSTWDS